MADAADDLPLASEFAPATREQWLKLVSAALKGGSFEKLVGKTYDGLTIDPLHARKADARPIAGRAPAAPWHIVQRADHPDAATANKQALEDLEGGATGLSLLLAGAPAAHGYGVAIRTIDDLDRTLSGALLDLITVRIETAPFDGRRVAELLTSLVEKRRLEPAALSIDFGLDPVGDMARTGLSPLPWPALSERAGATAKTLRDKGFARARMLRADGRVIHDSGGSEVQELAFVLACAVAYLRLLEAQGFTLEDARHKISFLLSADADQFLTMARFRALRQLWARVEEACGLKPQPAFVSAETAWRMMTRRDPYVNMLRTTIATAAAGLGGADAVAVLPHTAALGLPDAFARRVARNTQLILLEESNLAKVSDPAAGAGGIEDLTGQMSRAAWTLFQEIEAAGGAAKAIESGLIQKKVAATRAEHEQAIARRKEPLTGTSDFPHLAEDTISVLAVPRTEAKSPPAAVSFPALAPMRFAKPFEELREASDRMLAKAAARPKIFLANLGKPSDFTTRAMFAKNFFETGGIAAVENDGFGDSDAMIAAYRKSGAKLVCLCSSDAVYEQRAAEAARALAAAGATHIYLAGRPKTPEPLQQAGVNTFVYSGCDALAILKAAHDILGSKLGQALTT